MTDSRRHCISIAALPLLCLALVSGCASRPVQRYGQVIGIPAGSIPEYKRLHADTWPGVLKMIDKANIDNYSIYLGEVDPGEHYLFAYYEYTGKDFEADMARMAADETTQEWWKHTDPLQKPLPTRKEGEWWSPWEEVFHHDGPAFDHSKITLRYGSIVGIAEQSILAYTQLHAAVWPDVLANLDRVNIRNYSIYLGRVEPGRWLLFSYFEYIGDDFAGDMEQMADEVTKLWWTYTDPLQARLPGTPDGQQWKAIEEVFHTE